MEYVTAEGIVNGPVRSAKIARIDFADFRMEVVSMVGEKVDFEGDEVVVKLQGKPALATKSLKSGKRVRVIGSLAVETGMLLADSLEALDEEEKR